MLITSYVVKISIKVMFDSMIKSFEVCNAT